ncbi:MAG: PLP-dependent aminotransferase family protein [Oscillospiraceae bacterium]|nr:PLP-dependent aminotransferase family protein [Oscillospiraceae bacterium]
MDIRLADRMQGRNPSAIREILKQNADISFSAGNPSAETFPAAELAALAAELFENEYAQALQYGITEGYVPLRELTANRMREKHGIGGLDDDILITSGGQQGLDLAAKCLTNEGDTILCETPSFVGALNCFRSYRLRLVGIPMDEAGMDLDQLEQALRREPNVRFIYTIPTFQNPTGITTSLERRKKLLELARKYNVILLEDSPYFELRYDGEPVPALKCLDTTGHVLFVGSYSKLISPGMRIGYVIGHKDLLTKMVVAKQGQDVHTNLFFQILTARYLAQYDLDAHIQKCVQLYRARRDRMIAALERHLDPRVSFTRPDGGIFIWGQLPEGKSGTELAKHAIKRSLAIVPGAPFATDEADNPGFRLNFSVPDLAQIDRGVAILGDAIQEYIGSVETS